MRRMQLWLYGAGAVTGGTGGNATGLTGGIGGNNSWGDAYPGNPGQSATPAGRL